MAAIARGEPLNTMTISELDRAMGPPSKVNAANYGKGVEEQRIYARKGATWYVYTESGRVRSVQRQEETPAAPPQQQNQKQCPSKSEIWDMEVKASSITTRGNPGLQRDLENRLADMKACR